MTLALGGTAISCRKSPAPTAPPPAWIPLDEGWKHVMGGSLSHPEQTLLRLGWSESLSAAKWTGTPIEPPFELELEARRIDGTDFFCGITFPARESSECLTWVVGGWGGSLVGLSSIDGKDASSNETTTHRVFVKERWYQLRLKCTTERIEAWIDGERVIDFPTAGKSLGLRPGPIDQCTPFGLATWQTTGEFKSLRWRPLKP